MRYLRAPNPFQLRLGWLSCIARILGDGRLNRERLGRALLDFATTGYDEVENQEHLLALAGLDQAPLGKISPRAAPEIVRMAITHGIYDPEAQALTDLGQVLRLVDETEWRVGGSPFAWRGARRLLGLRLLLGADGDVILSILRLWPGDSEISRHDIPLFLAECLHQLAILTTGQTQVHLFEQLDHVTRTERSIQQYIFPRFEPLRELGYLKAGEKPGDYSLTEEGRRLAKAIPKAASADALLESGLSRLYFQALGMEEEAITPANPDELLETLQTLPPRLSGAASEVPLEPVVLLTQCRLLNSSPGLWTDLKLARKQIAELARASGGRIGLKGGTSILEQNITWTSPSDLRIKAHPEPPPPDNITNSKPDAHLTLHERLWLQYLARLLAPTIPGTWGSTRWGGPWSWLAALLRHVELPEPVLARKRDHQKSPLPSREGEKHKSVLATAPLQQWLEEVGRRSVNEPLRRCVELWGNPEKYDVLTLRGALLRANSALLSVNEHLRRAIRDFIQQPATSVDWAHWPAVREATRGLLDDAIDRGLWRRQELWHLLLERLDNPAPGVAESFLETLLTPSEPTRYMYTQEFSVPAPLGPLLEHLEPMDLEEARVELTRAQQDEDASPDRCALSAIVTLRARTPSQGLARGAEYAQEAISRLSFLGSLLPESPALPLSSGIKAPSSGRLADETGKQFSQPEPRSSVPLWLLLPEALDLQREVHSDDIQALRRALERLPALSAAEVGGLLDARTRLARSLHWLALADGPELRPTERLSHGWVAFEHLVTEGREQKGIAVMELAPSAVALCHFKALVGTVWRETLAGLHASACARPEDTPLLEHVRQRFGPEKAQWYASRNAGPVPLPQPLRITDTQALKQVLKARDTLPDLAKALEPQAPLAAWRLRELSDMLGDATLLARALVRLRLEIASFLMRVYEVRNQLVHEAHPFSFDDAHRLEDLYVRYRVLINPVVAEVMRLAAGHLLGSPLSHGWGLLRARFDELLEHSEATGKAKKDEKDKKGPFPVDPEHLLSCLDG